MPDVPTPRRLAGSDEALQRSAALALAERAEHDLAKEAARRNSASDYYGENNTPESVNPFVFAMATALRRLSALTAHDGWVKVSERLPEDGRPVLLDIGERNPVRAMYAEKHSLPAGDEMSEDICDYSEEQDEYFAPEGWYEWNSQSDTLWRMHNPIRWHEMPALPAPPADGKEAG